MNHLITNSISISLNDSSRLSGHGSSMSVPLHDKNCLCNVGNYCGKGDYRRTKKARVASNNCEDDVLQQEMERLTIKERESAKQAILGNDANDRIILDRGDNKQEEPAFLSLKFRQLDSEIETIEVLLKKFPSDKSSGGISAYKQAQDQNKAYVDNPKFKIGFLRAERYNPKLAAKRMYRYFELKKELFGSEKLTSDICLEDLGDDGRKYLDMGGVQILPERDKAGRQVIIMTAILTPENVDELRKGVPKAFFYMAKCLIEEDDEVGKIKGYVAIAWKNYRQKLPSGKAQADIARVCNSYPAKTGAFHLCRDMTFRSKYNIMLLSLFRSMGYARYVQLHYGSGQECNYSLLKYGVPDCLPLREGDDNTSNICPFHTRYHREWLAKRKRFDFAKKQSLSILSNPSDESFCRAVSCDNLEALNDLVSIETPSLGENLDLSEHTIRTEESASGYNNPQNYELQQHGPKTKCERSVIGCDILRNDVLLGQITSLRYHSGNVNFRTIVAASFDRYSSSSKMEKTKITQEIVQQIERDGGRFLKQTKKDQGGLWVEVSDIEARKKVASTFRNIVKKKKRESDLRPNDVLLGQITSLRNHPGNTRFRQMVADSFDKYYTSGKQQKTKIAQEIAQQIESDGGRFLKQTKEDQGELWVEVSNDDALKKVTSTFRNIVKKKKRELDLRPTNVLLEQITS